MMECNKEEAVRAKGLAEKKMEVKDFIGARKVALKAQQLFPDLDNISQMLMVCDVHCSAEQKILGKEMDWYGILQIDSTADEATIKKQYRKYALLLHPDKNKFTGAEAAFKLIGEAQRVLLDKGKRSLHDIMRRSSVSSRPTVPYRPTQQGSNNVNFGATNNFRTKPSFIPQHQRAQPPPQPGFTSAQPTFWTVCPFCGVKYQYYKEVLGKYLRCQNCSKSYVAHDINIEGVPLGPKSSMPTFSQRRDVPNQGGSKVEGEGQGTSSTQNAKREPFPRSTYTSDVGSRNVREKKNKKQDREESSESFDSRNSSIDTKEDEDHDICSKRKSEFSGDKYVRRSNRQKQQVSYKENLSDDDQVTPSKRAKGSGSNYTTEGVKTEGSLNEEESEMNKQAGSSAKLNEDKEEGPFVKEGLPNGNKETMQESGNGVEKENDSKIGSEVDVDLYVYPDPDFNDFDNIRKGKCFKCGQTWAIYDTVDAMPRFYAHIKKVFVPGFKLRITWLEPALDDEFGKKWVNKDLPVSCGKFSQGNTENTEDRLMFSHLVCCESGSGKNSYKIYPRKGETWALFKSWSASWATDPDSNVKYDYEFVEILSEYVEDVGLTVAYLGKVKGFVSLFYRMDREGTGKSEIPPSELTRFSHRVPSFEMSGEEREGVPKGSYELDPASLPVITEEIDVPVDLKVKAGNGHLNVSCSRSGAGNVDPMAGCEGSVSRPQNDVKGGHLEDSNSGNVVEDCCSPVASSPEAMEIPDPEFYNFDDDKSPDKFEVGQLWALYGDEDGLPRYYGQVTKIDKSPDFKVHVKWLECVNHGEDEDILFSCGIFEKKSDASQAYTSTDSFSHQLSGQPTGKKGEYAIYPRENEVWALYKNWNATNIRSSDLDNCDYEMVEVLENNDCRVKVLVLERVSGYNSVFKAQAHGGSAVTLEISQTELPRFSHQIPAFRLMKERGGKLRGCWELDPAALPIYFFSS